MKKKKSYILFVFTMFLCLMHVCLPAHAEVAVQLKKIPAKMSTYYFPPKGNDFDMWNRVFLPEGIRIKESKCKSSDPDVAVVEKDGGVGDEDIYYFITLKKPGKTTLKIPVKNEKTYTLKLTVTKFKNPLKQFKIGKKNYTKRYASSTDYGLKGRKNVEGILSIKPAKGYKLKKITIYQVYHQDDGYQSHDIQTVKDGDYIKMEYSSEMIIRLQNKSTKKTIELSFIPGYRY